jgi:hypothetical protein
MHFVGVLFGILDRASAAKNHVIRTEAVFRQESRDIARKYNLWITTVRAIRNGRTWRDVIADQTRLAA